MEHPVFVFNLFSLQAQHGPWKLVSYFLQSYRITRPAWALEYSSLFVYSLFLLEFIDKDRHSTNSSHETLIPRGSGVHTVHILQGQQGFVFNFDFGKYLDHIFSKHFAGVHISLKYKYLFRKTIILF